MNRHKQAAIATAAFFGVVAVMTLVVAALVTWAPWAMIVLGVAGLVAYIYWMFLEP